MGIGSFALVREVPFRLVSKDAFPAAGEEGRLCCLIHDMGTNYSAHPRALIRFESEDGISWTKKGVAFKKVTINLRSCGFSR